MKRTVLLGLSLLGLLLLVSSAGTAYDRWTLDIETGHPSIVVARTALGEGTPFLYFTVKLTNDTGKDRDIDLSIVARSDTVKRVEGEDVRVEKRASADPRAMKLIVAKEKRKLLTMLEMQGAIKNGESKEGVAIFADPDPEMDRVEFRIHGLVDPIEVIDGKRYFEDKVLVLHYKRPGDEFGHTDDPLIFVKKEWVIDGERRELPSARD
jgi:hypothetical protein